MISVIVYGRNDAHGYNIARRAALSLNCLAAVLGAPGDEILFVDWNTPDDLPTFAEAIADTLTPATLARLRVLRVRPRDHAPFAALTGRPVIEPVARNVALRRSDPANRWVLSTNTDMILVPRTPGTPLDALVADRPPALHHLPRFELPQAIWERLDRTRPDEAIAFLEGWAGRMRLRMALRMHDFLLYDAPGDFQLFPRADAVGIHGFDEAMVLGWHVDSNLARRFALLRGAPRSLADRLRAHHCEHGRHADPLHGHDHVEDDWRRFVDDVTVPDLPGQAESWGLAGVEVEEIRLPAGTAVGFAGLVAEVLGPDPGPAETVEDAALFRFDDRAYDPRTVVPFLADLLAGLDRGASAVYAGIDPGALALVRRLWTALGFRGALRVHPACPGLAAGDGATDGDDAADLFVVEAGALPDPAADAKALADLDDAVRAIVAAETARAGAGLPPRRVIVINGQRNRLTTVLDGAIVSPRGPSVTRLRHGFVRGAARPAEILSPGFVVRHLTRAEGRHRPVPVPEAVRLLTDLHALAEGTDDGRWASGAASLAELCTTAPVRARYGAATAARVETRIAAERPSTRLAPMLAIGIVGRPAPAAAPGRLAGPEDWEDPVFFAHVRAHVADRFAAYRRKRCRTVWEIVHAVAALAAAGVTGPRARVLAVVGAGSRLPDVLSRLVGRVDVLEPAGAVTGPATGTESVIPRPDRIRRLAAPTAADGPWDAVCLARGTLFRPGEDPAATAALLGSVRARLRPGGTLVLATEAPVDAPTPDDPVRAEVLSGDGFADLARATLGLRRLACAAPAVSPVALDMVAADGAQGPHFVRMRDGRPWMSGGWTFVAEGPAPPGAAGFADGIATLLVALRGTPERTR